MKRKTHSILTVVNAQADVERSLLERDEVDIDPQMRGNPQMRDNAAEELPNRFQNRISKFYRDRDDQENRVNEACFLGNTVRLRVHFGRQTLARCSSYVQPKRQTHPSHNRLS